MANIQISGLTSVTSLTSGDVFALDQSVGNLSKKITTANLAAAIVTTTNVTSAGALMDSEVVNLAQVKAFDSADYATAAQGTTADNALPTTGGAMTGAITTTSTFDGRDVATDGTKLDGIEANADVTDVTNVTAAGALMDSELTSIADVKALNQSLVIGAAPVLDATNMTNIPSGGVSIGDAIGGGAFTNSVLWVNGAFALSSSSKFTFDGASLNFTGGTSSSTQSSSFGVAAGLGNGNANNTSIGNSANQNSLGSGKTAVGRIAGQNSNGTSQVAIGEEAGWACVGDRAVSIGYRANRGNVNGGVAIGEYALFSNTGAGNTAVGVNAQNSANGSNNSGLGNRALLFNGGNNNSSLGYGSGESNTGSDVLALGYNAGKSNAQNNRLIIGFSNLPVFTGESAAAAVLPAASANGVYLYWDTTDNTIKARP